MEYLAELAWGAGKAFLVALILTPIIRDISRSYNFVDRPGVRKVHAYPIPRVGGIAIAAAYGLSLISFSSGHALPIEHAPALKIIPGAALIFLVGLIDDLFNLRALVKLGAQVAAGTLVFAAGLRVDTLAKIDLPLWASFLVTVCWIIVCTNALNLIDGLDGLCAGMGLLATLTLFGAALIHNNLPLAFATFPLAGALIGFLCFNFHPATVFLGDSGALLIGFLLGCYGMIWTQKAGTLLSVTVPLLALAIPLFDVSLSIVRRFLRNRPIFGADRGHIHHRLLDRGLSPRNAVLVLYLVTCFAAAFALLVSVDLGRFQGLAIAGFAVVAFFCIRQLRYSEFNIAGKWLFGGGIQRSLESRLRFETVSRSLDVADSEEQWWMAVSTAARDFGWSEIVWDSSRGNREQTFAVPAGPLWLFTIPLDDGETVRVRGEFVIASETPGRKSSSDLITFAQFVRASYLKQRDAWDRSRAAVK